MNQVLCLHIEDDGKERVYVKWDPYYIRSPHQILRQVCNPGALTAATRSDEGARRDMSKVGIACDSQGWRYPVLE